MPKIRDFSLLVKDKEDDLPQLTRINKEVRRSKNTEETTVRLPENSSKA